MRALVTGGAGFIGSHLVDRLIADGYNVTVIDNLSTGWVENLRAALASGHCRLVECDIADPYLDCRIADACPDTVFHLAAQIDVRASVADPVADAAANVCGTVAVLEAARKAGVRKVVNVSSVAIFGPPEQLPVTEATEANPLSPYAVSKLAAEMYGRQYQHLHGLASTTVVLTNVYGPRQRYDSGAVAIWIAAMLTGQPTYLYGGGSNIRDYLYVADAVDAIVRAASPNVGAPRVTVGTGIPVTDRQLHAATAAACGYSQPPVLEPGRLGDLTAMVVDPATARRHLGWAPRTSLAAGLAHVVEHTQLAMSRAQESRQPA